MATYEKLGNMLRQLSTAPTAPCTIALINPAHAMTYSNAQATAIASYMRWKEEEEREQEKLRRVAEAWNMLVDNVTEAHIIAYDYGLMNYTSLPGSTIGLNYFPVEPKQSDIKAPTKFESKIAKLKQRLAAMPTKITRNHR